MPASTTRSCISRQTYPRPESGLVYDEENVNEIEDVEMSDAVDPVLDKEIADSLENKVSSDVEG